MRDKADFKAVIVGHISTGKTCLFNRICKGCFSSNTEPTLSYCGVHTIKIDAESTAVSICLWDMIGDDRFLTPTRQFTRGSRAAIICCSLNDADFDVEKTKFWVHIFKKYDPQCKLYIAGTKCDLGVNERTRFELESYAERYNATYVETSSKDNINVMELFVTIAGDWLRSGDIDKPIEALQLAEPGNNNTSRRSCPC